MPTMSRVKHLLLICGIFGVLFPAVFAVTVALICVPYLYCFKEIPTIEIKENQYTARRRTDVKLECSATSFPFYTSVSWQRISQGETPELLTIDDRKYEGSEPNNPHLVIKEVEEADEGDYVCIVSNWCKERKSSPTKLTVGDLPFVEIPEANYTAVIGDKVELPCSVHATPSITSVFWKHILTGGRTIQLSRDGRKYQGSNRDDPHLIINDITKDDEGEYVCSVSNLVGEVHSESTKLTVKGGPPTLNMNPKEYFLTEGTVAILKCMVVATPQASSVVWTKEGSTRAIAPDNDKYMGGVPQSPSLIITKIEQNEDQGNYICEATNAAGQEKKSVKLTIDSKSLVTVSDFCIPNKRKGIEQRVKFIHGRMVNTLSDYIYPGAEEKWVKFTQLLHAHVPPRYLGRDLQHIVNYLIQEEIIEYGKNDKLYEAVYEIDKHVSHIINEAESEIKTIREGGMPGETSTEVTFTFEGGSRAQKEQLIRQIIEHVPELKLRISGNISLGSIVLKLTIRAAKTPHERSALEMAVSLKAKVQNGLIVIKDESDVPLVLTTAPTLRILTDNPKDTPYVRLSKGHYQFTEGENAILKSVVVATSETESIQWIREENGESHTILIDNKKYFGGSPNSPSLVIGDVNATDIGIYLCVAGNSKGETESNTAFVEVHTIVGMPMVSSRFAMFTL